MNKLIEAHLFLGDHHIPFHDEVAVELSLKALRDYKWTSVTFMGDLGDFYPVSSHLQDPKLANTLSDELFQVRRHLGAVRNSVEWDTLITLHEGNHEDRLQRYMFRHAKALSALPGLSIPSLYNLGRFRIDYRTKRQPVYIRGLMVLHGYLVRPYSAYTAKCMMDKVGQSFIQGHTHRLGVHHRTLNGRHLIGVENGCLCSLKPNAANFYTNGFPDWQHGFSYLLVWKSGNKIVTSLEQVQIHGNSMALFGKVVTV